MSNATTVSIEEQLENQQSQSYIMYLMQNSLIKILTDKGIIDKDELAKEMDELNERLYELTKDVAENADKASEDTVVEEDKGSDIPEA